MKERETDALAKTNRINLLFDFYEPLLTEKQRTFLTYYFHDDYSLGEIAEQFDVSRQAIYEHIKRAETALEEYESKLQLLARHERRQAAAARIADELGRLEASPETERMQALLRELMTAL
ncbi:putative DNA-binding protein [Paenibacillus sp.]|uniref:putative DNA-binding protein n=1 Tax=Paenibacillus sp. TaxID=58172 RepID=UPI002D7093FC|nr:putative DNA-binding protein [Paenibacillus sp.]HZG58689.1 putative DNA-binding protein [Paenibacillus sp.]